MKKIVTFLLLSSLFLIGKEIAIVKSVQGTVQVKREGKVQPLQLGSLLYNGDILMTKSNSSVGVIFDDGSSLALGSKGFFTIKNFIVDPTHQNFDEPKNRNVEVLVK